MKSEVLEIRKRLKERRTSLKETLSVMEMALEDPFKEKDVLFPHEMFEGLDELIGKTLRGTKIAHCGPEKKDVPFHTFEIHTEGGECLGYLNMIYYRSPLPCYYLVYVEVLSPFRGRGLGGRILQSFREFAEERKAIGLLDNIIPPEEPTHEIYSRYGFRRIEEMIDEGIPPLKERDYMIFIPYSLKIHGLREKLKRLLFRIEKKRSVIEMHDNESMVRRTIEEFKAVYETLESLFEIEITSGSATPFMCFMFTKFITRLLGFRRRIAELIGYTGGESLEQIVISEKIKALPIQSYSLWNAREEKPQIGGEEEVIQSLPGELKREPTLYIEALPLYKRPYLTSWAERRGGWDFSNLKISDLLDLGFDPTRLREVRLGGLEYIFERVSPHFLSSIEKKRRIFQRISQEGEELRFGSTSLQINPPLLFIRERGNLYILRRRLEGIHLEEALDQLRGTSHLKKMNQETGMDRRVLIRINQIKSWVRRKVERALKEEVEDLTFFIPWDIERNIPRVQVHITEIDIDKVWVS